MTQEELEFNWHNLHLQVPGYYKAKPLSDMFPIVGNRMHGGTLFYNGLEGEDSNGVIIRVDENDECWVKTFVLDGKGGWDNKWDAMGKLILKPDAAKVTVH